MLLHEYEKINLNESKIHNGYEIQKVWFWELLSCVLIFIWVLWDINVIYWNIYWIVAALIS